MTANLIISLDCEGKWGLSDYPNIIKNFTNKNLIATYKKINELFSELSIPVTYAFVGSFILTQEERKQFDCFNNIKECYSMPLINYFNSDIENKKDGWFLPELYDLVNNEINEIASHSFSHMLFDENKKSEIIDKELNNCMTLSNLKKIKFETFIFPYNKILFLEKIHEFGFKGYRNNIYLNKKIYRKISNLINEWNIWKRYDINYQIFNNDLVQIPGGAFFNWRYKLRKYLIPSQVTILKWKNLINYSYKYKKTLNLWFHPHNIISAPSTFDVLKEVIFYANKMRENGKLNIITQKDYVKKILLKSKENLSI